MEYILAIVLQVTLTFPFLNILRLYAQNGNFKKLLHIYGLLCPINAYIVHIFLLVASLEMRNVTIFEYSDPLFRRACDIVSYGMTLGNVGALLFCMVALELLPLVINTFQEEKGLKKIKKLKWFTFFFFLLVMTLTISTSLNIMPEKVIPAVTVSTLAWPVYALTLQMTALNMLLKHLMEHFKRYVAQSPEASRKLLKVLKFMIISNSIGMSILGLGFMNFLAQIINFISQKWNILLMQIGFNIFFITLSLLTFYIFNIKNITIIDEKVDEPISYYMISGKNSSMPK
jgi:hypothetical protein